MDSADSRTLQICNGSVIYEGRQRWFRRSTPPVEALSEVTFAVEEGSCWGLVGESGSGKSTLGRCLCSLQKLSQGTVSLDDKAVEHFPRRQFCRRVQMVFQNPHDALNPLRTVEEIVAEPLRLHFPALTPRGRKERIEALLDGVHLPTSLLSRLPGTLSGGQKQRVAIARSLAVAPRFLICDEVVSALDVTIQREILDLLGEIQRSRRMGMLFITHDFASVGLLCNRVAVLDGGKLVETGTTAQLLQRPSHPKTRALVEDAAFFL